MSIAISSLFKNPFMMKKRLLLFPLLFLTLGLFAQTAVSGKVTGQDGAPLIGANILVKGASAGTVTDIDGNYSLVIPTGYNTLIFSYTGFNPEEIEVSGPGTINVTLTEGVVLNEAVVTALGISREKKSLGYATQEVDGENLTIAKTDNFVNTLSG